MDSSTRPSSLYVQLQALHISQEPGGQETSPVPSSMMHSGRPSRETSSPFAAPSSSSGLDSLDHAPSSPPESGLLDGLLQARQQMNGSPSLGQETADTAYSQEGSKSICFDFTKGLCTRGDKCKYSHDLATIVHFNSKEKGICFDYLRNQCHRGLLCRFSHDLSNIAQQCQVHNGSAIKGRTNAICYDFVKGVCQRGNECRYSHDLSLIARTARGGAQSQKTGEICYDFLRGRCNRGTSCKYSHNISFLAAPNFLAGAINNNAAGPTASGAQPGVSQNGQHARLPPLPPGVPTPSSVSSLLTSSLSGDPAAMSAAVAAASGGVLSSSMSSSLPTDVPSGRPPLAPSLSSDFNNIPRHDQTQGPGSWSSAQARAGISHPQIQAAALNGLAYAQQQHFAAAAAAGLSQQLNGFQLQQAVKAAQMAAGVHASDSVSSAAAMGAASGFAAAAAQQQAYAVAQHQAAARAAMAPTSGQQIARTHSAPMPKMQGMPGGPVTAESISAILQNLGDNPALLAETLTGLAVAAQAQAQAAYCMPGAGAMNQASAGNHSAPQPIPGRLDAGSTGPTPAPGSYTEGYGNHTAGPQHLLPSGSLPAQLQGINPASLPNDLLPLLKEIWNK